MSRSTPSAELIVTGFGPFGAHSYNPSTDAARSLADARGTEAHLLSVTYTTAAQFARAHLHRARRPVLLIHLGLGARRSRLCFEHRAKNERDDRQDQLEMRHDSALPGTQPVFDEPPTKRSTGLDVDALAASFNERRPDDLPRARTSDDCGSFVCNALYYHSLRACDRYAPSGSDALFIHIPELSPPRARRLRRMLASLFIPKAIPTME